MEKNNNKYIILISALLMVVLLIVGVQAQAQHYHKESVYTTSCWNAEDSELIEIQGLIDIRGSVWVISNKAFYDITFIHDGEKPRKEVTRDNDNKKLKYKVYNGTFNMFGTTITGSMLVMNSYNTDIFIVSTNKFSFFYYVDL